MNSTERPPSDSVPIKGIAAIGSHPILRAKRTSPCDPADSGWQFLCDSGEEEDIGLAQLWSVEEVLDLEPSLSSYLTLPVGTNVRRAHIREAWDVEID